MKENDFWTKLKLNMAAFVVATAGTLCFPQILNLKENELGFTNSFFSVFVWLLCWGAVRTSLTTIDFREKRGLKLAGAWSFLFAAAMLFGTQLESAENVNFKDWKLWISLPVLTCLFTILVRKAWDVIGNLETMRRQAAEHIRLPKLPIQKEWHRNVLTFCFLLCCWLPVLLAAYPGFFVYDAQDEFLQVATRTFTTHHPLAHVLLLGGIICGVHKVTDSYNLGIVCYMLVQMGIVSGGFTYLLSYLRRKGVSKGLRLCSMLYFGFFPVIVMFTLCSAKDTIFTMALLLLMICLLEMGRDKTTFFGSKKSMIFFALCGVGMMLFRKNGIYAFGVMVPILLLFFRKNWKKMVVLLTIIFAAYFAVDGSLTAVLHAENEENQEILTVPIQQLARTYHYNREVFAEEDVAALHEILPEEALDAYRAKLSDPVKWRFNNQAFAAEKGKYAKLWLKIGCRKPLSYVNAWFMTSYGFWYPDTVIDVYEGNSVFTFTYEDCSYFGYEVEQPGVRESKIPWLDECYRKLSLEVTKEKIPILSMLYSPGWMFWMFAFAFCYAWYRKQYHVLIPYGLVFLVWLTVILGPTYLPRYVLIFWFGLPLFAAVTLEEERFGLVVK